MLGWLDDIEKATLDNENFRAVLFTGKHTQLTVMSLARWRGDRLGVTRHPRSVHPTRTGQCPCRVRSDRGCGRRDARGRGRLGLHRPGRRLAQRGQHGERRGQALLAVLTARTSRRHGPSHQGGGRRGRALTRAPTRISRQGLIADTARYSARPARIVSTSTDVYPRVSSISPSRPRHRPGPIRDRCSASASSLR